MEHLLFFTTPKAAKVAGQGPSSRANARDLRKISPVGRNDNEFFFACLAALRLAQDMLGAMNGPYVQLNSGVVMIGPHRGSAVFLLCLVMLLIEHARFGAPGTLSLLAPDLGGPLFFRRLDTSKLGLDFIQQDSSGQETIEGLGALLLALDPDT